jgi:hypothetical protein
VAADQDGLIEITGSADPFYLRKLTRRSHWETGDTVISDRLRKILAECFREDGIYSFYEITSVRDLQLVAIALNSGRSSLTEQIDFIPFFASDFAGLGILSSKNQGDTSCTFANGVHWDFGGSKDQIAEMCRRAIVASRNVVRLQSSRLKKYLLAIKDIGCRVHPDLSTCAICDCLVGPPQVDSD